MKAPVTVKEQLCVCNGGTEPEICDFCSLALFPCWTDLHIWHTCSYVFPVSVTVLLSCCLSDAKEQKLSSEADLGGNLHPAGLAPTLSGGPRNVPLRGASFQLLGFDVTSNCTLIFVLISHRGLLPVKQDKYFCCFSKCRCHVKTDLYIHFFFLNSSLVGDKSLKSR